jgi:hypothetical protein
LFVDSVANALAATITTNPGANYSCQLVLEFEHTPGDTAAHTYKIRVGPITGTLAMNGYTGSPYFGNKMHCTLVAEEVQA